MWKGLCINRMWNVYMYFTCTLRSLSPVSGYGGVRGWRAGRMNVWADASPSTSPSTAALPPVLHLRVSNTHVRSTWSTSSTTAQPPFLHSSAIVHTSLHVSRPGSGEFCIWGMVPWRCNGGHRLRLLSFSLATFFFTRNVFRLVFLLSRVHWREFCVCRMAVNYRAVSTDWISVPLLLMLLITKGLKPVLVCARPW